MSETKPRWSKIHAAAIFSLCGADAVRYLNGQVTQHIGLLVDGKMALPTAVTDALGKLQFRAWVTQAEADRIWILVEAGVDAEAAEARLGRYLIADDAELVREESLQVIHVCADLAPVAVGGICREAWRVGKKGWDLWISGDASAEFLATLGEEFSDDEWETARISASVPRWGREMLGGEMPNEVGLADSDLHFHKGCYIGQEVISRLKASKRWDERWKQRLEQVEISPEQAEAGHHHWDDEHGTFTLTSVAPLPEPNGTRFGLGIRIRKSTMKQQQPSKKTLLITAGLIASFFAHAPLFAANETPRGAGTLSSDLSSSIYKNPKRPIQERVKDLLSKMTLEEKIGQLNQRLMTADSMTRWGAAMEKGDIGSFLPDPSYTADPKLRNALQKIAMEKSRLGIPMLVGFDTIHGFRTIFPIPIAQACSFDPSMVEKASAIAARESAAAGIDWVFAPMCDVARDPRWGRVSEGYGEDAWLTSRFVEAAVKGFQGKNLADPEHVLSTLKHFVGYSAAEGGRDYNTVEISDRTMRDVYLPPFEAGVKAGALTVMTAFHSNGGIPATGDGALMNQVLRGELRFPGFVVSDWTAVREMVEHGYAKNDEEAARFALEAGVDMEMVSGCFANTIGNQVKAEKISLETLNRAVARILSVKFARGLFEKPYADEELQAKAYMREDAVQLAREAVQKSCVLLKNEANILPLQKDKIKKVALIGTLADNQDEMLGSWQGLGHKDDAITLTAEMRNLLGADRVVTANGCPLIETAMTKTSIDGKVQVTKAAEATNAKDITDAVELAKSSDVVILCLGEPRGWSGENASRTSLGLTGRQQDLFDAVADTGKPVIVLLFTGRPLSIPTIADRAAAILVAWQPGVQAGPGLCDLLFGKVNPTGRLTMTWPRNVGQSPTYYGRANTGRPQYGDYKDVPQSPLFPFGFGLGYAPMTFGKTTAEAANGKVVVTATVRNAAAKGAELAGDTVAQLYVRRISDSQGLRPLRELRGIQHVKLAAGEEKVVKFELSEQDLARLGTVKGARGGVAGDYQIWIAPDSRSGEHASLTWGAK